MGLEGEQAPDFTLPSTAGDEVSLSDRLEEGPAIVIVNRGHWCSFCAEQLQTFSEVAYDLWFNDKVDVLPVVTDTPPRLTEMRDRYDLDLQLQADPDGEVADQYSVPRRRATGSPGSPASTSSMRRGRSATSRSRTTPRTAPTATGFGTSSGTTTKTRSAGNPSTSAPSSAS